MTDVFLGKIASLQRCIQRAREIYRRDPKAFLTDYDSQDAAVLNLIRACETAIDLANLIIKTYKMGIPKSSAESFELIRRKDVIPSELEARLVRMVGFRNVSVHQYMSIDFAIVANIITKDVDDLIAFGDLIREYLSAHPS